MEYSSIIFTVFAAARLAVFSVKVRYEKILNNYLRITLLDDPLTTYSTSAKAPMAYYHDFPRLPSEVLHQVFEVAARDNIKTALTLAVLSHFVKPWIEEIIYLEVNLYTRWAAYSFLRTIHAHTMKPSNFFEICVKSLFICPDLEPADVLAILSTCNGAVNISYWPVTGVMCSNIDSGKQSTWETEQIQPQTYPPIPYDRRTLDNLQRVFKSFDLHNLYHLSPKRLSLILHDSHHIFSFQPIFQVPFFSGVTHLSIVNKWEDWTTWAGFGISSNSMPQLTHLKFDLEVGDASSENCPASRSRWLDTVTNVNIVESMECINKNLWMLKMSRTANALSDILNNCHGLHVCVLTLRFDNDPSKSAKIITRMTTPKLSEGYHHQHENDSSRRQPGFDPRLVFVWEKEPFRYSHAHSVREKMLWKSAEAAVKVQRQLSSYTMPLNCDYLIQL